MCLLLNLCFHRVHVHFIIFLPFPKIYLISHQLILLYNTILDITDIKFVINVDFPSSTEDYIHRIGRTARSDRTGTSYTFFTVNNAKQARDLVSVLEEANQHVNPKLYNMIELSKNFGRSKYVR